MLPRVLRSRERKRGSTKGGGKAIIIHARRRFPPTDSRESRNGGKMGSQGRGAIVSTPFWPFFRSYLRPCRWRKRRKRRKLRLRRPERAKEKAGTRGDSGRRKTTPSSPSSLGLVVGSGGGKEPRFWLYLLLLVRAPKSLRRRRRRKRPTKGGGGESKRHKPAEQTLSFPSFPPPLSSHLLYFRSRNS